MGTAELHQGSYEFPAPSPRPPSVSKEEESGKNEEITKDIDIVSSNRGWKAEPMCAIYDLRGWKAEPMCAIYDLKRRCLEILGWYKDYEKIAKSAEVENEDNFMKKGTYTTSMNKEDHGKSKKSVAVGMENIRTFSTGMKKEDHEKSVKSAEDENEDNFKEKGTSPTTSMNKEGEEKLEYRRCIICLDADLCMVFFPCRHVVACEACSDRLKTCPVCRALIRESVKVN